jgi:hypothetical protein
MRQEEGVLSGRRYVADLLCCNIVLMRLQLFNAIAVLMGVGMLSEPLAFARAGWIGGTSLLILYGLLTCYT